MTNCFTYKCPRIWQTRPTKKLGLIVISWRRYAANFITKAMDSKKKQTYPLRNCFINNQKHKISYMHTINSELIKSKCTSVLLLLSLKQNYLQTGLCLKQCNGHLEQSSVFPGHGHRLQMSCPQWPDHFKHKQKLSCKVCALSLSDVSRCARVCVCACVRNRAEAK